MIKAKITEFVILFLLWQFASGSPVTQCGQGQKLRFNNNTPICCFTVICYKNTIFKPCNENNGHDTCGGCGEGRCTGDIDPIDSADFDRPPTEICKEIRNFCDIESGALPLKDEHGCVLRCVCDVHNGFYGYNEFTRACYKSTESCDVEGQEMSPSNGKCVTCAPDTYKSWKKGRCKKKTVCGPKQEIADPGSPIKDSSCKSRPIPNPVDGSHTQSTISTEDPAFVYVDTPSSDHHTTVSSPGEMKSKDNSSSDDVIIGLSVGGGVLLLIGVAVGMLLCILKRKKKLTNIKKTLPCVCCYNSDHVCPRCRKIVCECDRKNELVVLMETDNTHSGSSNANAMPPVSNSCICFDSRDFNLDDNNRSFNGASDDVSGDIHSSDLNDNGQSHNMETSINDENTVTGDESTSVHSEQISDTGAGVDEQGGSNDASETRTDDVSDDVIDDKQHSLEVKSDGITRVPNGVPARPIGTAIPIPQRPRPSDNDLSAEEETEQFAGNARLVLNNGMSMNPADIGNQTLESGVSDQEQYHQNVPNTSYTLELSPAPPLTMPSTDSIQRYTGPRNGVLENNL